MNNDGPFVLWEFADAMIRVQIHRDRKIELTVPTDYLGNQTVSFELLPFRVDSVIRALKKTVKAFRKIEREGAYFTPWDERTPDWLTKPAYESPEPEELPVGMLD